MIYIFAQAVQGSKTTPCRQAGRLRSLRLASQFADNRAEQKIVKIDLQDVQPEQRCDLPQCRTSCSKTWITIFLGVAVKELFVSLNSCGASPSSAGSAWMNSLNSRRLCRPNRQRASMLPAGTVAASVIGRQPFHISFSDGKNVPGQFAYLFQIAHRWRVPH